MKETIKTYTEITVEQAEELLRDNNWEPVGGLSFWNDSNHRQEGMLHGIDLTANTKFRTLYSPYTNCATVTELDPCQAPDGRQELEPWQAYVGLGSDDLAGKFGHGHDTYWDNCGAWIASAGGFDDKCHYVIDVRTDWAKENFPEHCRIRNYQESDPLNDMFHDIQEYKHNTDGYCFSKDEMREAYELGQQNPQPTK